MHGFCIGKLAHINHLYFKFSFLVFNKDTEMEPHPKISVGRQTSLRHAFKFIFSIILRYFCAFSWFINISSNHDLFKSMNLKSSLSFMLGFNDSDVTAGWWSNFEGFTVYYSEPNDNTTDPVYRSNFKITSQRFHEWILKIRQKCITK